MMSKADWTIMPGSIHPKAAWIMMPEARMREVTAWMTANLIAPVFEPYVNGNAIAIGFDNILDETRFALRWPQYWNGGKNVLTTLPFPISLPL